MTQLPYNNKYTAISKENDEKYPPGSYAAFGGSFIMALMGK
jgi:hypothetical protein